MHEYIAPRVIGRDPLEIDRLSADLVGYVGFRSTGAEMRGNSAFDIALWDLFGKATGQPIAQLLGGFTRREIRTYNTCAGTDYIKKATGQTTANYGLGAGRGYDDLERLPAPRRRAGAVPARGGHHRHEDLAVRRGGGEDRAAASISLPDLKAALEPFEKIRQAVGDRMDIMVELHSMWQLLPAMRDRPGARALPDLLARGPDPHGQPREPEALCRGLAGADRGLRDAGRRAAAFRDLLETGAAGVVIVDISWCGGLSARRARSPRWPRPGTCRWRRTTAPGRWCLRPRRICR